MTEAPEPRRGVGDIADVDLRRRWHGGAPMSVTAADLVARDRELARLGQLLAHAREGVSGALVLCGPAGLGKTALVDATLADADGFAVLRARGVEGEAHLPYAALSQLLLGVVARRDELADEQRAALEGALALGPPGEHDQVAVGGAVLALLALVAEDRPLLVAVDDLHWADEASRAALRIAALRLAGEGVAMVLATRPDVAPPAGIERLDVSALPEDAARALLARVGRLTRDAADRVVETADGNPLALLEIPRLLRGAGGTPGPLPAGATLEAALMVPVERLPAATRTALLVAASDEQAPRAVLDMALGHAGVGADALAAAEEEGLVARHDDGVTFRHPLLRSAVYHAASGPDRRGAHGALAAAWPHGSERWTWHAAGAALGPDAHVAGALDALADSAHRRGAHDAAARAWIRAAELSPSPARRYQLRLTGAGELLAVGAVDEASALLDLARDEAPPQAPRTPLEVLQGRLALRRQHPHAARRTLLDVAERLAPTEPVRAAELLLEATMVPMMAGDAAANREDGCRALELAEGRDEVVALAADVIYGHGLVGVGEVEAGEARLLAAAERTRGQDRMPPAIEGLAQTAHVALWGQRFDIAELLLDWLERAVRRAGAAGALGMPLLVRARMQTRRGRLVDGLVSAAEAVDLAEQTGQISLRCTALAWQAEVEALLGRGRDARAHAEEALRLAHGLGTGLLEVYPHHALALVELGAARVEPAIDHLTRADAALDRFGLTDPGFLAVRPLLVEALARAGEAEEAARLLDEYEERAERYGRRFAHASVAQLRGILADDGAYEGWFARALELHPPGAATPFGRGRTLLALGSRRRRSRRRAAARAPLAEALAVFERMGAAPWAAQARHELELAGAGSEDAPAAGASALDELTPQELRVAMLVGRGLSNRQVAGALFVSSRTVEAHLRQIYRKLDLRSRTELAGLVANIDA